MNVDLHFFIVIILGYNSLLKSMIRRESKYCWKICTKLKIVLCF